MSIPNPTIHKQQSTIMADTSVRIQVLKNDKCIFQKSSENTNDNNNITALVTNLKMMQQQVNDILTTLVELERNLSDEGESSDSETDTEEDDQVNPKKCRLSN